MKNVQKFNGPRACQAFIDKELLAQEKAHKKMAIRHLRKAIASINSDPYVASEYARSGLWCLYAMENTIDLAAFLAERIRRVEDDVL